VGQTGIGQSSGSNGGGGGGSFVVDPSNNPLLIAGGGGGTRSAALQNGINGQISQFGTIGSGSSQTNPGTLKTTGLGQGGIVSATSWGSAGAGFFSNGANDSPFGTGGRSWAGGLVGGDWGPTFSGTEAFGGFGGGGAGNGAWGGGGGYSGGDGGLVAGGGGRLTPEHTSPESPALTSGMVASPSRLIAITQPRSSVLPPVPRRSDRLSTSPPP
jgi:hypothetical protein